MKAIINTAPGGPEVLQERDAPDPQPSADQIRVRVHASALNRADISQRRGSYPAPAGAPADIPGLEFAGEIDLIGESVTQWKIGDRVMGLVGGGAHAELVCTHELEAMRIPRDLSFDEAAAIPEVFITAYDAIFLQLGMQVGERLLIHAAASGVGTAAIQLARKAGLETVGTSRSADKLRKATELGLNHSVHATGDDWPDRLLEIVPGGVDAVLELVGGAYLAGDMKVLRHRGKIILVGLTAGRQTDIQLGVVLTKRLTIVGTVLRSRALHEKISVAQDFAAKVLPLFDDRSLVPVIDRVFPFSRIREAHQLMESNDTFGKIVLSWS